MLKRIVIMLVMVVVLSGTCFADSWTDSWDFNILGINPKHFKDRSPVVILSGCVSSFVVHELGHYIVAETNGDGDFDFDRFCVTWKGYQNHSKSTQNLFHLAGFLAQEVGGLALTVIPSTRPKTTVLPPLIRLRGN